MRDDRAALRGHFARRASIDERLYDGRSGFPSDACGAPCSSTSSTRWTRSRGRHAGSFLEVGCGTGHLAAALAQRGARSSAWT